MAKDFAEMRKNARLPERIVDICLRGDLAAEHQEMEQQLDQAQRSPDGAIGIEGGPVMEIAGRIRALEEQMRDDTYPFRLRALTRSAYRSLKDQHEPRRGDDGEVRPEDAVYDVNMETWQEPLIRACLIDPVLSDAEWAETVETLTDRQFQELVSTAIYLNRGAVDVPFSRAASNLLRSSVPE